MNKNKIIKKDKVKNFFNKENKKQKNFSRIEKET